MNLVGVRTFEMLSRVGDFGAAHTDQFPATSVGGGLFAVVNAEVSRARGYAIENGASDTSARELTAAKTRARDALHTAMNTLCRTARAVAGEVPGLERKFRMPYTRVNQRRITAARTMAQDAAPHADRFVAHGLAPTFLTDLTAAADTFAAAIQDHAAAKEARAAAAVGTADAIAKGVVAAKRLDAIVKNVLAGNSELLAAWKSARHVSLLGLTSAPAAPQPAPQQA